MSDLTIIRLEAVDFSKDMAQPQLKMDTDRKARTIEDMEAEAQHLATLFPDNQVR